MYHSLAWAAAPKLQRSTDTGRAYPADTPFVREFAHVFADGNRVDGWNGTCLFGRMGDLRDRPDVPTLLIEQAALVMGVSRRTVYYRIREGRLETITTRCGSRRIVVRSFDSLRREGVRRNAATQSPKR